MQTNQREHIDRVMQTVGGAGTPDAAGDSLIHDSWRRCARDYRLDPTCMQEAIILPSHRLREHQDRMNEFLQIARSGIQALYQHVAGLGYVVLLTDARGITVDFLGDLNADHSLRRAGLYLGSNWSEPLAGTCGVGTCISTGQALTVHQGDHFDATHIPHPTDLHHRTGVRRTRPAQCGARHLGAALAAEQGEPAPGAADGEDLRPAR